MDRLTYLKQRRVECKTILVLSIIHRVTDNYIWQILSGRRNFSDKFLKRLIEFDPDEKRGQLMSLHLKSKAKEK